MIDIIRSVLMYFVLPVWLAAGFVDWICHRRSRIAETAGPKESLIHFLMFAEVGLAIVGAIFLEINALTLILIAALVVTHELTVYWDLQYAGKHREITPLEQQVHSFLEMMPVMALILVGIAHWGQVQALVGLGDESARFVLLLQEPKLPAMYLIFLFSAVTLFSLIPYAEELWRGLRARRRAG